MENGKSRLEQTREGAEEVKLIMLDNLNKAEERSGKLDELEDRAEVLLEKSKTFEKKTNQVKQKKKWENNKMKVIGFVVAGVVIFIVIALIVYFSLNSGT